MIIDSLKNKKLTDNFSKKEWDYLKKIFYKAVKVDQLKYFKYQNEVKKRNIIKTFSLYYIKKGVYPETILGYLEYLETKKYNEL